MILSLSGCDINSIFNSGGGGGSSKTEAHSSMIISSSAFERGKSYRIYKDAVPYSLERSRALNYYVADVKENPDKRVTLNLEFEKPFSNDAFVIVEINEDQTEKVVFGYNPLGSGDLVASNDNIVYGSFKGRNFRTQYYTSLDLSSELIKTIKTSSIQVMSEDEIVIDLRSDGSASLSGSVEGRVPQNDFIWHVAQDHAGEYWTDSSGEKYESEEDLNITDGDGVYIAHDIRYVPDSLVFSESQMLPNEKNSQGSSENMYVAYYNKGIKLVPEDNSEDSEDSETETTSDDVTEYNYNATEYNYVLAALPSEGFENLEAVKAVMTHSETEAYNNPVLHITKEGTYRLRGTWKGQILVDIPNNTVNEYKKTKDDPDAKVTLVLDNVNVECTVGLALIVNKVYECGPNSVASLEDAKTSSYSMLDDEYIYAGAVIVLADESTNTFKGTNVARLNNPKLNENYTSSDIGQYVKAQDKMYKYDGAFHSKMSMALGIDEGAKNCILKITGDYEGLNSEKHMLIDSGTIRVIAEDDGINVNEDGVSVFTMTDGRLTVISKYGDGIDSNGYIVFNGAEYLNVVAAQDNNSLNAQAEGPLDADLGIYMSEAVQSIYQHSAYDPSKNYDEDDAGSNVDNSENNQDNFYFDDVDGDENNLPVMQPKILANSMGIVVLDLFFGDTAGKKIESDDEGTRLDASPQESDIFYLEHRINNFSGLYDYLTRSDNNEEEN